MSSSMSEEDGDTTSLRDPLRLGRNVRTSFISRKKNPKKDGTGPSTSNTRSYSPFVCNCLSCGKVYDCRYSCLDDVVRTSSSEVRAFISSGGECQSCGTLIERAAKALGVVQSSLDDEPGGTNRLVDESQRAAYALRDTLVAYDREAAARTTVIDDQNEYYDIQANAWLSDDEREELIAKEEMRLQSRAKARDISVTVSFDMLGRKCIEVIDETLGEERATSDGNSELLRLAQDSAMKERPYGGGRSVVGPDAALTMPDARDTQKGRCASFVESLAERNGDPSGFLAFRKKTSS